MGDAVAAAPGRRGLSGFDVRVAGTAPLEQIEFFRGTTRLQRVDAFATAGARSNRLRIAWKGAAAPGNWERARMRWDGLLRVAGARIVRADGFAFDSPDEGITGHDHACVRWRSVTAGDWDGVVVELDDPAHAELCLVTAPMSLRTRPGRCRSARPALRCPRPATLRRVALAARARSALHVQREASPTRRRCRASRRTGSGCGKATAPMPGRRRSSSRRGRSAPDFPSPWPSPAGGRGFRIARRLHRVDGRLSSSSMLVAEVDASP